MTEQHSEISLDFLAEWQNRFAGRTMPRDFFPLLHSLAEYLRLDGQARQSAELLRCEESMGVNRYLGHRLEQARLLVLALFEVEDKEEARRVAAYYTSRPYLFDDPGRLGFFLFCRSGEALEQGDGESLAHCVKLLAHSQAGTKDAYLLRVIHQAGGLRRLLAATGGRLDVATGLLVTVFWGARQLKGLGVAAGGISRGLHFCLNMLRVLGRLRGGNALWMLQRTAAKPAARISGQRGKDRRPILVTRAMGGIGDILMMTPGLKALARKFPDRQIHFALPKAFHDLLAHNPDIVLKDINGEVLRREDYYTLYNLSECPASRVESATLPKVRRNRIDIFAAAMGIGKKRLDAAGRVPVYTVTEEERAWAENFFAVLGLAAEQCIAVQPYAADSYKDYPYMEALVTRLADERPVLLFHSSALQGFDHPGVIKIDNHNLRRSIALLSLCSQCICVDSSFVHIAAALGKKTVALFGPTDGGVCTKHYSRCAVLGGHAETGCSTCWRNSFVTCGRSASRVSACLKEIPIEAILHQLRN